MTEEPHDHEPDEAPPDAPEPVSPEPEPTVEQAPEVVAAEPGPPEVEAEIPHVTTANAPPSKPKERSLVGVLFVLAGLAWAVAGYARARKMRAGPVQAAAMTEVADRAQRTPPPSTDPSLGVAGTSDDESDLVLEEPEAETGTVGEPEPALEELPPGDWIENLDAPETVTYTVRHGGSIKNVANLFKIYHHEITALNPQYQLEQQLPPNTKVVVWRRKDGTVSESIGLPGSGSLEGAVPMMEGPGRVLKATPWKAWGTEATVTTLDAILREWARRKPDGQPVLVGNLSAPKGGKLDPHSSHQSGRDVDLSYIQIENPKEELNWREMSAANLDAAQTWELLQLLRQSGKVEAIFIDSKIQKLLYEHAVEAKTVPKPSLARWIEYPRQPGTTGALIRHVPGHRDHIHVRFRCPPEQRRCRSR